MGYGQEVPERWVSTLEGMGRAGLATHFESGIIYTKRDYRDSVWTIVDAIDPRAPEIIGPFGLAERCLDLPEIEGDRAAAISGDDRVAFFDLSDPADPRFVSELVIDEVKMIALGRKVMHAARRHRSLEGRRSAASRYYLHTYGNRYSDGWPTDYAFQSVDVTDLEEPVWLGRWHMDLPYPMPSDEQLEAVGEVGVFAATFGGWYAPCETQFATWIAEADSIRPVEWRLTNDTVVAMETYGASLLLTNTCMPHSICDNWLSAYEITGDGYLAALPAHRCWDWVHCARAVTDPTGVFYVSQYYWDLVFTATAVAIDAEGELETRRAPRNLLRDDCGPEIAPIRGALVAACWNNVLRIKPTEYVEAPVLLGDWVDGGARKIESIRPTRLPPS